MSHGLMALQTIAGAGRTVSSLRGPNPPALVCQGCGKIIHEYWEHPLLKLAVKKGWYQGAITGGTGACYDCDNAYMQKRIVERHQHRIERAGLPLVMQTWTLSTYPGSKHYGKLAEAWLEAEVRSDVVLFGPPGTAKTGLCVAMVRELLERNLSVRFVRASELAMRLRASYAAKDQSELGVLQPYLDTNTLVLDDVTALRKSDFFEDTLWTLLDHRQKEQRPTLITLNCTKEERETFFGPLLFDRLRESAQWWHLDGASVRKPRR